MHLERLFQTWSQLSWESSCVPSSQSSSSRARVLVDRYQDFRSKILKEAAAAEGVVVHSVAGDFWVPFSPLVSALPDFTPSIRVFALTLTPGLCCLCIQRRKRPWNTFDFQCVDRGVWIMRLSAQLFWVMLNRVCPISPGLSSLPALNLANQAPLVEFCQTPFIYFSQYRKFFWWWACFLRAPVSFLIRLHM